MEDLKNIVESLLFVSETPLTPEKIKQILTETDIKEIKTVLEQLKTEYTARQGGFLIREAAGGYQFCTRSLYKEWIKRLLKPGPRRLSKAALETLAVIAWNEPAIRSDIEHIRGVDCGGILRMLLEKKLIRILGRKEIPGRPHVYATTKRFLEIFDLKDIKDLPTLKEIEALKAPEPDKSDGLASDKEIA
jgi:segregation and condensation protein B